MVIFGQSLGLKNFKFILLSVVKFLGRDFSRLPGARVFRKSLEISYSAEFRPSDIFLGGDNSLFRYFQLARPLILVQISSQKRVVCLFGIFLARTLDFCFALLV